MFLIKDKKIINEKLLNVGKLRQLNFAFQTDLQFADADNFKLILGKYQSQNYSFVNDGVLQFIRVDVELKKVNSDFNIVVLHNDIEIINDTINIIAEIQGQIALPEVTVTSDKLLKDVTAINTAGEIVTGNISNSVITETENQVFISKGYLHQNKSFQIDSSDVQGFIFNNIPCFSTEVILTNPDLAKDETNWANWWDWRKKIEYLPDMNTENATAMSNFFSGFEKLKVCPNLNTAKNTSMQCFFQYCYQLQQIPFLDTTKATSFIYCFTSCKKIKTIPLLDFSSSKSFSSCFSGCASLEIIPQINTSSATDFSNAFYGCNNLHTVPALHAEKVTNLNSMFYNCSALTNFGGLIGITKSWSLQWCKNLTHQSLLNVLNNLGDLTGKTMQTLTLGTENLAKLSSSEKNIATQKNWALA